MVWDTIKTILRQPAFVVTVLVLGIAASSLNVAVGYMQLHFKKQPVRLAKPLASLPAHLGPWRLVSRDEPLDKEMQDVLGTDHYIFRDYVNVDEAGVAAIAQFTDKNPDERRGLLSKIRKQHPDAVINLGVTYYTGLVDTVAHIPDRCYVADGYQPRPGKYEVNWNIRNGQPVEVRFINFEDQTSSGGPAVRSVSYFFHVNGHYEASPNGVRLRLQNLLEKHGYYAKVEVMTLIPNAQESASVMTNFLSHALPEIEKTLPDWQAVKRQEQAAALAKVGKK